MHLVKFKGAAAAEIPIDEEYTFVINAHGSMPKDPTNFVTLPSNVTMIKSIPGANILQEVSRQVFSEIVTKYKYGFTAQQMFDQIKRYYDSQKKKFYGKIYRPNDKYTDMGILFKVEDYKKDINNGDILSIVSKKFGTSIANLRDIKFLKDKIFDPNNVVIDADRSETYNVKLSSIIQFINSHIGNSSYLLIVDSCSEIDAHTSNFMRGAARIGIEPDVIKNFMNLQGFYSKYLKYKKKYLNLRRFKMRQNFNI
jgi:hypothetical protein